MENLQAPSLESNPAQTIDQKITRAEYLKRLSLELNNLSPVTTKPLTPVTLTKQAYEEDEVKFYVPYGPHGYGKSAYLAQCLAQIHGTWDPEVLKNFIVWKPSMFGEIVDRVEDSGKEEMLLGVDDAGIMFNALKWNHPLLAAITEYFDVIRKHFHGIMLTTILPTHVIKKIRGLPQALTIKIIKVNRNWNKPRKARGYSQYMMPDLKHTGVRPEFEDSFFAIMPEKFYSWYKPARKGYTKEAWERVKTELNKWKTLEPQTAT